MIIKYCNAGSWHYIDNIKHIFKKQIDTKTLIEKHDKEVLVSPPIIVNNLNNTNGIIMANKAFLMATSGYDEQSLLLSVLDPFMVETNRPAATIVMDLNNWPEFDSIVLVTNQDTYLMNDEGKTIERLI